MKATQKKPIKSYIQTIMKPVRYYFVDDEFGNPKLIKTSSDGCEVIKMDYRTNNYKKATFDKPYPPDSGERLMECNVGDWRKFEVQCK